MRTSSAWLLGVLALSACTDDDPAPRTGGGGVNNITGGGGGGGGGGGLDAGADAGGVGGPCGFPIGEYSYRSTDDGGSDCSQFTLPLPEVVYTQQHTFVPAESEVGNCTVSATEFLNDGCTLTQALACSDGSSSTVTCTLDASARSLDCRASAALGGLTCETTFVGEREQAVTCSAPVGVYSIALTSLAGSDAFGCAQGATQEQELERALDALLMARTGCSWNRPTFDATTCAYERRGTCIDDVAEPLTTCTFTEDGTVGTCEYDDGQCVYELELTR